MEKEECGNGKGKRKAGKESRSKFGEKELNGLKE